MRRPSRTASVPWPLATASGEIVEQARHTGCLGTVYFSLGDYRRAMDVLQAERGNR